MRKSIILILVILSCSFNEIFAQKDYIKDDKIFGELINGIPEKDSLIELKNEKGIIIGIGKVAKENRELSLLKFGEWKEYNETGILLSKGNYKIGSFIDCCFSGLCKVYYYYRDGKWEYFTKNGDIDFILNFIPKEHIVDTRCEGGDKLTFGLVEDIPIKYNDRVTLDKVYELQKISVTYTDKSTTIMIPLNGKLYFDIIFRN